MYITKANFRRIFRELDVPKEFKFEDVILWTLPNGREIKGDWDSSKSHVFSAMFSQQEKNRLMAFKALCKGDTGIINYVYNKVEEPIDSLKYVRAEKKPVYHSDPNCPAMKSDYERVGIPEQIIEQGKEKVLEYRKWWNENSELRESNFPAFVARLNIKFPVDPPIRDFDVTTIPNSGAQEIIENRSVADINDEITAIWNEFVTWLKEKHGRIANCMEYGYLSWMGNSATPINKPLHRVTEEELKEQLRIIDMYKNRLYRQLQELYIRQYIPDLDFDDSLLKSLGFEPCFICAMNDGEHDHEE